MAAWTPADSKADETGVTRSLSLCDLLDGLHGGAYAVGEREQPRAKYAQHAQHAQSMQSMLNMHNMRICMHMRMRMPFAASARHATR